MTDWKALLLGVFLVTFGGQALFQAITKGTFTWAAMRIVDRSRPLAFGFNIVVHALAVIAGFVIIFFQNLIQMLGFGIP